MTTYAKKTKLPVTRQSLTRKNSVGEMEFYVTVGFYNDPPDRPGEVFVNLAKEGSTLGGLCSQLALIFSMSLQYGVPWEDMSKHLRGGRFDPCGLGLDGQTIYPSLSHAIAHTIDLILEDRKTEVYGRTLVNCTHEKVGFNKDLGRMICLTCGEPGSVISQLAQAHLQSRSVQPLTSPTPTPSVGDAG